MKTEKSHILKDGPTTGNSIGKMTSNSKNSMSLPSNQITAKASQENIKASVESFPNDVSPKNKHVARVSD